MPTSKAGPRDALENPEIPEPVRALARRGEVKRYAKGTLLIQEGELGSTVYVILKGRLRAYGTEPVNGRELTYDTYGPGELVGEMGLDGGPRSANVITLEPTLCAVVASSTLLAHLREQPDFALDLLKTVIRRARASTRSAKLLALADAYGRLRELLLSQSAPQADGTLRFAPRPTHRDLATRIGCTRERVTMIIGMLETGGYVAIGRDAWVLQKALPERL